MIEDKNNEIDYSKLTVWTALLVSCGLMWYSIFTNGFFVTLIWLIIISAIVGIGFKLWDMRV